MTAPMLFSIFNILALTGWILMLLGVIFERPFLYEKLAGVWLPVLLSAVYTVIIVFFFGSADGGFDTLANVQKLFENPWVALGGWVHYLAFDMFIGSHIVKQAKSIGLPRWLLFFLLPLTFLFGPIGYIAFEGTKALKLGARK